MQQMREIKKYFSEPRSSDGEKVESIVCQYKEAVRAGDEWERPAKTVGIEHVGGQRCGSGSNIATKCCTGAILFAVCRGKVSVDDKTFVTVA